MRLSFNELLYLEKEEIPLYIKIKDELIRQILEIRRDPITGFRSRINKSVASKPRYYTEDTVNIKDCVFCKDNVFEMTPNFDKKKKFVLESTVLFPNAYPYSKNHLIIVPNYRQHVRYIKDISILDFVNSFLILKEYIAEMQIREDSYIYINLNRGYYAGASQDHLHFQVIIEENPTVYHNILIEKSKEYFYRYNRFFLEDLVKFEKENKERFIYEGKMISFISSFAPFRNNEVFGISKTFGILTLPDESLRLFAEELYKFLLAYESIVDNYNLTIMDVSFVRDSKALPFIRILQRNKNDIGYLELLHLEYVVSTLPEDTAKILREKLSEVTKT